MLHHAFDAGEDDAVAQDFPGQEHECGSVGVEPEPACGNGQRVADNGQPGKQKGQGSPALEQVQGLFRRPFLMLYFLECHMDIGFAACPFGMS